MVNGLIEFVEARPGEPSEHVLSAVGTAYYISPVPAHPVLVGTCKGATLPAHLDISRWLVEIPPWRRRYL
jgi:hypothetical protein